MMITVKKLFLCGGVFLIVVIILMMIMTKGQPSGWLRLNEVEAYENILDSKISEITLRKTVDSANWVVFSDDDLIKIWIGCLKDMEVRRAKNFAPYRYEENGGGGSVVEIETETEKYSLVFRNSLALLNSKLVVFCMIFVNQKIFHLKRHTIWPLNGMG